MESTRQRAWQSAFYIDYIYICSILAEFYIKAEQHIAGLAYRNMMLDDESLLNNYKQNKHRWSDKFHNNNNLKNA